MTPEAKMVLLALATAAWSLVCGAPYVVCAVVNGLCTAGCRWLLQDEDLGTVTMWVALALALPLLVVQHATRRAGLLLWWPMRRILEVLP